LRRGQLMVEKMDRDWAEEVLEEFSGGYEEDRDLVSRAIAFLKDEIEPFERVFKGRGEKGTHYFSWEHENHKYVVGISEGGKKIGCSGVVSWIDDVVLYGDAGLFVTCDSLEDFWDHPPPLYHATPRENVASIRREGLVTMNETRGIANRGTSAAVFTSLNFEGTIDSYGDAIFKINTRAMARDGQTPRVSLEEPVLEYDQMGAIISVLDAGDEIFVELESGIDPETVVVFGRILPKYLKEID